MAQMKTTSGATVEILMRDLDGKKVKTRQEMRNGWTVIPAGTVCSVDGTWRSGASLVAPPCPHCGVKVCISRVHRNEVLLVDDEDGAK